MSKNTIRENKACLNCGSFVEKRFCPKCGQENRESRESFFHLVLEFIFDLVHFDSSFWKTTRYLLFSPAKLSLEYMAGKRKSYANPIKLYIFISFIAFFLPEILPTPKEENKKEELRTSIPENWDGNIEEYGKVSSVAQLDSIHISRPEEKQITENEYQVYRKILFQKENPGQPYVEEVEKNNIKELIKKRYADIAGYGSISSVAELDSVHNLKAPHERLSFWQYAKYKYFLQALENITDSHKQEKMIEFIVHNLSKVLFIYMPVFSFWIWLFNLNRRKYYFDSGIFTLHFFSFWLLIISIFNIINCIFSDWLNIPGLAYGLVLPLALLYITFYFFRGNRIFYSEKRWLANIKGVFLLLINTIFIILIFVLFALLAVVQSY